MSSTVPGFEEFDPDWCMRPGVLLAEELKAWGLKSPSAASKVSGLPQEVIDGVLNGSVEITEPIAEGLARIGGGARLWLNAERIYRAALAAGKKDLSDE